MLGRNIKSGTLFRNICRRNQSLASFSTTSLLLRQPSKRNESLLPETGSKKKYTSERRQKQVSHYKPVDLQSDVTVRRFYRMTIDFFAKFQKNKPVLKEISQTKPCTPERKEKFDEVLKIYLSILSNFCKVNEAKVWSMVRMARVDDPLPIDKVLEEFKRDFWQSERTYLDYENDQLAFTNYVDNPPLLPTYGRIWAIFENYKFVQDSKESKAIIDQTLQLFLASFLRYYRTKTLFAASGSRNNVSNMDLKNPEEWFSQARQLKRKVVLHIGPTNSGKTYSALKALEKSNSGYYAGPLRLLAREVYNRFKAAGKKCNLVTGEEVIEDYDAFGLPVKVSSGTIEMVDTTRPMDVAVIDEIQMIEDTSRGWAWTQAFLGVQAREVHLCGDPSSEEIIRYMCSKTGDELEIKKYFRLSPLKVDNKPIDSKLKSLRPGDCIVAFSKNDLLDWKSEIERLKKSNCSIIYGALPPESRTKQADLFNDSQNNGYEYLVASDAVGMGLNLSIKRIIFLTTKKFNGKHKAAITISQIKQIAGRAGRYKSAPSSSTGTGAQIEEQQQQLRNSDPASPNGRVSALSTKDLQYIRKCLSADTPKIKQFGLFPSHEMFRAFSLPLISHQPFVNILNQIQVTTEMDKNSFLCGMDNMIDNSKLMETIRGLTLNEQMVLSKAPVKTRIDKNIYAFQSLCQVVAASKTVTPLDIPQLGIAALQRQGPFRIEDINEFEVIHSNLILYLWLSYRFPMNFRDRMGAFELKALCEKKIDQALIDTRNKRLAKWEKTINRRKSLEEKEEEEIEVDTNKVDPIQDSNNSSSTISTSSSSPA